MPALVAIEQDMSIEGLLIILNTVGGDVEAGLAISELIAGMSKPTVSIVVGGGHSIGVPLAVATDYSFIAPTACGKCKKELYCAVCNNDYTPRQNERAFARHTSDVIVF